MHREFFEDIIMDLYCAKNKIVTWRYVEDIYARHVQPYEKQIIERCKADATEDETERDLAVEEVYLILKEATEL